MSMLFPELMISIRGDDKVLEIGPGSSPQPRSNAFLELSFMCEQDVKFDAANGVVTFMPKEETAFAQFSSVTSFFHRMLELGWDDLCTSNKTIFCEGVEFNQPFAVGKANTLEKLLPAKSRITQKQSLRHLIDRIENKLKL